MAGETKGCPLAEVRGIYTDCSLAGTRPTRGVFEPKRSLSGSGECSMNLNRVTLLLLGAVISSIALSKPCVTVTKSNWQACYETPQSLPPSSMDAGEKLFQ